MKLVRSLRDWIVIHRGSDSVIGHRAGFKFKCLAHGTVCS